LDKNSDWETRSQGGQRERERKGDLCPGGEWETVVAAATRSLLEVRAIGWKGENSTKGRKPFIRTKAKSIQYMGRRNRVASSLRAGE